MGAKLWAALGALVFAAVALHGTMTGRYKTREFKPAAYMRRRDHPVLFWTYTVLLVIAALCLSYAAIFIA